MDWLHHREALSKKQWPRVGVCFFIFDYFNTNTELMSGIIWGQTLRLRGGFEERVVALVALTRVERVVHDGGDVSSSHLLRVGVHTTRDNVSGNRKGKGKRERNIPASRGSNGNDHNDNNADDAARGNGANGNQAGSLAALVAVEAIIALAHAKPEVNQTSSGKGSGNVRTAP